MAPRLQVCPFCGGGAELVQPGLALGYAASVSCLRCKAIVVGYGPEDVAAAWNARQSGWIPVSERLPSDLSDDVIIALASGAVLTRYFLSQSGEEWLCGDGPAFPTSEVTHWMPTPSHPGGE
jgi:hypothetical protein